MRSCCVTGATDDRPTSFAPQSKKVDTVLSQDFGDGYQPVAYASRSFTPAERNYNTTERELRGLVFATTEAFHMRMPALDVLI
jgi:hypothetical protein